MQGPYYVNGEPVRSDIREDQEGASLYAEVQIIDVNTCESVEGLTWPSSTATPQRFVLLDDSVSDGVLVWTSVGVDMTRAQTITAAGTLMADGGVMAVSASTMGGRGFSGGSGMGVPTSSTTGIAQGSSANTTRATTTTAAVESSSSEEEEADTSCSARLHHFSLWAERNGAIFDLNSLKICLHHIQCMFYNKQDIVAQQ
ncbi:unnamed protein product [Phytophthora lilii]|uniref:Unnamed protein product n=1 Tax=Phytophthora lilii TaxID=2077276 RepID=A0A9W6U7I2_9STRA|nr:unnamed protein product [Phytophthora lilii]